MSNEQQQQQFRFVSNIAAQHFYPAVHTIQLLLLDKQLTPPSIHAL